MPFPFLPLDGITDTKLQLLSVRGAHDAPRNDDQHLPRGCFVAADYTVEAHERHLERFTPSDPRV